jgi:predicted Fe-Mo cluster-binding NifX family protein
MKLLIPVLEDKQFESRVSEHFGQAYLFAVFNSETKEFKIVRQTIDHSSDLTPVDQIMVHDFDTVYVLGVGGRAIKLFREKGIKLKTGEFRTVKEVVENLDELKDLKEGCGH